MAVDAQWRGRWGGRGWRGGWGGAVAAGVIGGLALGAIASAPYSYYGYGPSYGYARTATHHQRTMATTVRLTVMDTATTAG